MTFKAGRLVFDCSEQLAPNLTYGQDEQEHAYSIFDLGTDEIFVEEKTFYSKNQYTAFTVGSKAADVLIRNGELTTELKVIKCYEHSMRLQKDKDVIHVHTATEADLFDRTYVFRQLRFEKDPMFSFIFAMKSNTLLRLQWLECVQLKIVLP